jgi:hypothetical protein
VEGQDALVMPDTVRAVTRIASATLVAAGTVTASGHVVGAASPPVRLNQPGEIGVLAGLLVMVVAAAGPALKTAERLALLDALIDLIRQILEVGGPH